MIINIERLEQNGYTVERCDGTISIYPQGVVNERLARVMLEEINLPTRQKEELVEQFVNKVNNAKIMLIIDEEY